MSNKYDTSDGEEEFVVVNYKDCSINEEKFDSTSITSINTMKNEKRNTNMTDEVNSLKTKSDTCFTTMDDRNRNSSEESFPYDEMMEKAEEVVNSILKKIPDEYVPKSDDKKSNDVIEEDGESKHQENDEYSILSVNNINNNQNEEETEDIFVSDPKPTTTHYVSESIISNTASALPALENFVEHISDNIIDTSTDIVNKITDQTKEPFQNILDYHENNMNNIETTNYMFENEKPAENSRFYDEPSNDNFEFPKSSHDMFNDDIEELKKTEEAVDEGFSNALFGTSQLLQKSNDFFTNETPIKTNTVISSQLEEAKDISEPILNKSDDFHTFENYLKEEEEIRNDNDMLDFSSVDEHENNDSSNTSPTKNFFEEEITHQPNVILSSNDEPITPEGKVSDTITDFEYSETTPDNYSMTYNNHEYKNEELKEQSNEEDEAFHMNTIPVSSVPEKANDFHYEDKIWNDSSNEKFNSDIVDSNILNKTSDVFAEVSRDDKDHSFNNSPEGGLHTVVDDILDRINAAASTTKHQTDQEISPVVEENESNGSPRSQNVIEISDVVEKNESEQYEEEDIPQRNGPLTIPQDVKNNDNEKDIDNDDIPKEPEFTPRPPTPPKDLNDDEYQPEVINLGPPPASHHFSTAETPKPILKSSYHHEKAWIDFKTINPKVMDILYWRDPKKSGVAFSLSLLTLLLLTKLSVISLFAYASLLILTGTLGFRLFKAFEAKVKSGDPGNPFKTYLNEQLTIPGEKVHAQVDVIIEQLQAGFAKLQKLFLIENIVESLKFVGICWALTYIGGWFSMLGLSFIIVIGAFTLPKVYEVYQEPIDAYLKIAKEKIQEVTKQIEEKVPCLSKMCGSCPQNAAPVEAEKKDQ